VNTKTRISPDYTQSRVADLTRLKDRCDRILNDVLCDMQPGWDDSIEGFNKAWDIVRDIFKEEIDRAAA
jgi:hypothetical protein